MQVNEQSIDVSPLDWFPAIAVWNRLNLQVRVAGWNVRWNDIPRKEQDEYIARIEVVGR